MLRLVYYPTKYIYSDVQCCSSFPIKQEVEAQETRFRKLEVHFPILCKWDSCISESQISLCIHVHDVSHKQKPAMALFPAFTYVPLAPSRDIYDMHVQKQSHINRRQTWVKYIIVLESNTFLHFTEFV